VPGTEEYANSEKYQFRKWDWNRPGNIKELVARVNRIRHQERALQFDWTLQFHSTDNPEIVAYSKRSSDGASTIVAIVNLDPHHMQHGFVQLPSSLLQAHGIDPNGFYMVHDLLDDTEYGWRGEWNYVRFDPDVRQGHLLKVGL
jgi:starch synthase (maltosyl-transferring)